MTLPLKNRRILVTRAAEQAGALEARLRELGAEVIVAPSIAILPPAGWEAVDRAIDRLPETDWVAFTSPNGVRFFLDRLEAIGGAWPEGPRVAAVGPGTAEALEARGLRVELTPSRFDGVALAEALCAQGPIAGKRVLLPRGDQAASDLPVALMRAGALVTDLVAYRTEPVPVGAEVAGAIAAGALDWAVFMSGSAFRGLAGSLPIETLRAVRLASIGPRTSAVIRSLGHEVALEAAESTAESLVEALSRACGD